MTLYAYSKKCAFHVVYNYSGGKMNNLDAEEIQKIMKEFNRQYLECKEYLLSVIKPYLPNGDVTLVAPCVDIVFSETKRDAYKIVISNEGNIPFITFASACESCEFFLTGGDADFLQAEGLIKFFFDAAKNKTLNVKT
jgi:hypothetical protein